MENYVHTCQFVKYIFFSCYTNVFSFFYYARKGKVQAESLIVLLKLESFVYRARSTTVRMERPHTQIFRQGRQKREKLPFFMENVFKVGRSFGKQIWAAKKGGRPERALHILKMDLERVLQKYIQNSNYSIYKQQE